MMYIFWHVDVEADIIDLKEDKLTLVRLILLS